MDEMKREAQDMQDYLEITYSTNPEELQKRIIDLSGYMARSGEMLADAKRLLRSKKSAEIRQAIIEINKQAPLSASVQNALLESICEEECHLVEWLDRINRACTHQLDAVRSLLSYEKESLRLTKTGY